jgi:hypothetical protein
MRFRSRPATLGFRLILATHSPNGGVNLEQAHVA